MKKILAGIFVMALFAFFAGCKKDNYPGGVVSPYVSLFDVRDLYRGETVTLSTENLNGADKIAAVVVSDHSGGNMPDGLLVVQDRRRLSKLRGIAINIGADASTYLPGDSLVIDVAGGSLVRKDGILQIDGLSSANIMKIASGAVIDTGRVLASELLNTPQDYESTLVTVTRVGFDASYPDTTTYKGERIINDGFGNILLHTEPAASFANETIPFQANFTGIVFRSEADSTPRIWSRTQSDIVVLSATAPKLAPLVISGFLNNPAGSDGNYEYIQLMATRDIDFSVTPFSLVTTNNAGSATPTGFPAEGWATGDLRTYKFNLSDGMVTRGQFIYVGANKNIYGAGSTDISAATWYGKMYADEPGDDFGNPTSNLLANSGNAAGIAIFDATTVSKDSIPVDVIFFGGNGSVFTAGPPQEGYRIANTDYYDRVDPSSLQKQPYFNQGSNTKKLSFPASGNFVKLGGVYNVTTARWTTARLLNGVELDIATPIDSLQGMGSTMIEQ